jgi:hypothetical protein
MTSTLRVITTEPTANDKLPVGFQLITADARLTQKAKDAGYTEQSFESLRYRRICIPQFPLDDAGLPPKFKGMVYQKLAETAQQLLSTLMENSNRSLTEIPADLFSVDGLCAAWHEFNIPKVLTASEIFAWAKTSSFASRHRAKFNDEARTLTYLSLFNQFADKGDISLSLEQVTKLRDLFTEEDMTGIGRQVKAKMEHFIIRMSKKSVSIDEI